MVTHDRNAGNRVTMTEIVLVTFKKEVERVFNTTIVTRQGIFNYGF